MTPEKTRITVMTNTRNEIRGVNALNEPLWMAREAENGEYWEGTGLKYPGISTFVNFKSALMHFLIAHPETDTISGILNGQYRIAFPHNAAATTLLDTIAKELGQ